MNKSSKKLPSEDVNEIRKSLVKTLKFDRNNFDRVLKKTLQYAKSKGLTIEEPYKLVEGEYTKEKTEEWDDEYYFFKADLLKYNFALKERLPHIKEIGKVVFAGEESHINGTETNDAENPGIAPSKNRRSKKKNTISIGQAVGVIAATAAIIGAIIWIIQIFR